MTDATKKEVSLGDILNAVNAGNAAQSRERKDANDATATRLEKKLDEFLNGGFRTRWRSEMGQFIKDIVYAVVVGLFKAMFKGRTGKVLLAAIGTIFIFGVTGLVEFADIVGLVFERGVTVKFNSHGQYDP